MTVKANQRHRRERLRKNRVRKPPLAVNGVNGSIFIASLHGVLYGGGCRVEIGRDARDAGHRRPANSILSPQPLANVRVPRLPRLYPTATAITIGRTDRTPAGTKDEGTSGHMTPVRYSSPAAMNKGISLALEFYKKQHRLPAQHECTPIAERAMTLLNSSDPGFRHYVTGGQIASQFNNVSRDLSAIVKRLEKKRKASVDNGDVNEVATNSDRKRSHALEEQRLLLLQYLQTAKRGGSIPEDFTSEELGEITALPPPAPKASAPKEHANNGAGASSSAPPGSDKVMQEVLSTIHSLKESMSQMAAALSSIGKNMRGVVSDDDLLQVLESITPDRG